MLPEEYAKVHRMLMENGRRDLLLLEEAETAAITSKRQLRGMSYAHVTENVAGEYESIYERLSAYEEVCDKYSGIRDIGKIMPGVGEKLDLMAGAQAHLQDHVSGGLEMLAETWKQTEGDLLSMDGLQEMTDTRIELDRITGLYMRLSRLSNESPQPAIAQYAAFMQEMEPLQQRLHELGKVAERGYGWNRDLDTIADQYRQLVRRYKPRWSRRSVYDCREFSEWVQLVRMGSWVTERSYEKENLSLLVQERRGILEKLKGGADINKEYVSWLAGVEIEEISPECEKPGLEFAAEQLGELDERVREALREELVRVRSFFAGVFAHLYQSYEMTLSYPNVDVSCMLPMIDRLIGMYKLLGESSEAVHRFRELVEERSTISARGLYRPEEMLRFLLEPESLRISLMSGMFDHSYAWELVASLKGKEGAMVGVQTEMVNPAGSLSIEHPFVIRNTTHMKEVMHSREQVRQYPYELAQLAAKTLRGVLLEGE